MRFNARDKEFKTKKLIELHLKGRADPLVCEVEKEGAQFLSVRSIKRYKEVLWIRKENIMWAAEVSDNAENNN